MVAIDYFTKWIEAEPFARNRERDSQFYFIFFFLKKNMT